MANKDNIDVNSLPKGLSKRELLKQPQLKKINSWFTWAGVVQIITGVFNLGTVAAGVHQLEARGYIMDKGFISVYYMICAAFIILGILLLVMRSTVLAWIVGITAIVFALYAVSTGGTVGIGIIAAVLAIVGAVKFQGVWKEYQGVNGQYYQ